MRAGVQTRYGPPEVVGIAEVETPIPRDDEILVQIHVTTVNRTDCGFRAAHPWFVRSFAGLTKPRVQTLGSEFAGTVAALGANVSSFQVGQQVFGFNEGRWRAHAEYLTILADGPVAPIPDGVGLDEAAASTEASHYALTNIRAANVVGGTVVLVNGATGAIGSAAIQLLKHLDATVTAVSDTEHMRFASDLGADRVIDRRVDDFTQDPRTYDLVFDAVGKSSYGRCKRLLRPRGIYASTDLGPYSLTPLLALITRRSRGKRVMFPIPPDRDRAAIDHIAQLLASGAFRPVIDRRYRLDELVDAYRYVESGQKIGNVLITVVDPASPEA